MSLTYTYAKKMCGFYSRTASMYESSSVERSGSLSYTFFGESAHDCGGVLLSSSARAAPATRRRSRRRRPTIFAILLFPS